MMQPIEFEKDQKINLNSLKRQIDRRVDVITMMIRSMRPAKQEKLCADKCCEIVHSYCQTEKLQLPLCEIPNLSLSNTPSMKSLKSPTNLKSKKSVKDKENKENITHSFHQSPVLSIKNSTNNKINNTNNSKRILNSIQESEQQGLKTSRYLKQLESEKKKTKPEKKKPNNNMSTAKKSESHSVTSSNLHIKLNRKFKHLQNSIRDDRSDDIVVNSFESSKKKNFTEKKSFNNAKTSKFLQKQPTTEEKVMNFSFSSSIPDQSESKSRVGTRKGSVNFNDSFILSISANHAIRKPSQSFSTANLSSTFITQDHFEESIVAGPKRIAIGEEVKLKMEEEFACRLEKLQGKINRKEMKANNIRISLLKRLDDKHLKALEQVAK